MNNNPIGILDSGLGGLTVWKEIVELLPHESTVYIADSFNTPYGTKTPEEIFQLSKRSVDFLIEKQAKIIVTACNAISVSCIDLLRDTYPDISIVGTFPAVKTAVKVSKNKRIGILATTRTTTSVYQSELINQFASDCKVFKHGTDAIVPLIEKGEMKGVKMKKILEDVLAQFKVEGIDCLVLGCTHFPFIRDQMQEILGPGVVIVDSGEAIARRVKWLLEQYHRLAEKDRKPEYSFYTTGDKEIAKNTLNITIEGKELPDFLAVNL